MERQQHGPERHSLRAENLEQLIHLRKTERAPRPSPEKEQNRIEQARHQIERHAEHASKRSEQAAHQPTTVTAYERSRSYRHTLSSLQHRLRPRQRSFSHFIHRPIIERTSDVVANTIARPSVTLGATITAALVGGFFYISARRYGFELSGSEFIVSLFVGGLLGFVIELSLKAIRRRQA